MKSQSWLGVRLIGAVALLATGLLAGCSGRDADLDRFIAATKKESGGRIEPLPEIKPYDTFAYADANLRSPFVPGGSAVSSAPGTRPDVRRNREFLEQYPLDTLRMVGTLKLGGQDYGLVQVKDGRVQRVLVGNYMGQYEGRITGITPSKISLIELVPDGLGAYIERSAALALNE